MLGPQASAAWQCRTRLGQLVGSLEKAREFRGAELSGDFSAIVICARMNPNRDSRDPYLVKSVVHSSKILSAFRSAGEALSLKEVAQRSGLPKTMSFRLLYTLEKCGMVEKVGVNLYQSTLRPAKQRVCRLGYAAQGTDYQFSRDVTASLERAAKSEGIELIALDNRYSAKIAQRNA